MNKFNKIVAMNKISGAFLITALSGLLVLTGCTSGAEVEGNNQPSSTEAAESVGNVVEAALSASDKLPDNFPKDIPIPKDAQTLASMTQGDSMTVSFDVNKSFDETLKIYKEYFKSAGYQMESEMLIEDSYVGNGTLGGNKLVVTISMTTDDSQLASVSLTYQSKKQ